MLNSCPKVPKTQQSQSAKMCQVVNRSHLSLQAVPHSECYESLEPTIGTSLALDAQFIVVIGS